MNCAALKLNLDLEILRFGGCGLIELNFRIIQRRFSVSVLAVVSQSVEIRYCWMGNVAIGRVILSFGRCGDMEVSKGEIWWRRFFLLLFRATFYVLSSVLFQYNLVTPSCAPIELASFLKFPIVV